MYTILYVFKHIHVGFYHPPLSPVPEGAKSVARVLPMSMSPPHLSVMIYLTFIFRIANNFERVKTFVNFVVYGLMFSPQISGGVNSIVHVRRSIPRKFIPCEIVVPSQFVKVFTLESFPLYDIRGGGIQ